MSGGIARERERERVRGSVERQAARAVVREREREREGERTIRQRRRGLDRLAMSVNNSTRKPQSSTSDDEGCQVRVGRRGKIGGQFDFQNFSLIFAPGVSIMLFLYLKRPRRTLSSKN